VRTKDEDGFEWFASRVLPRLLRTGWLLTGDAGQAEDAAQEALVRLYAVWPKVRDQEPEQYVLRILRNVVVSTWRKDRRLVLVEEVRDSGSATASSPSRSGPTAGAVADRLDLVRALQSLPAREREVVVLRHYADLSERAVAEALGVSVGTVKSSSSRGLERLRTIMSDQGEAHVR
jgi:RNA polymerase sigma-70 factor (sigma-E family)